MSRVARGNTFRTEYFSLLLLPVLGRPGEEAGQETWLPSGDETSNCWDLRLKWANVLFSWFFPS